MSKKRKRKKTMLKKIRNAIIYWTVWWIMGLGALIPLRYGLAIGAFLGRVAFFVAFPIRRKMLTHLRIAFPKKDDSWRWGVARRTFMNLGRGFFEFVHFGEILDGVDGRGKYAGYLQVEGAQHPAGQFAAGNGALFITGHCGNWELMAVCTARLGYPVNAVVRNLYDSQADKLLNDRRERYGCHPIIREDKRFAREIVGALRKNEFVGLLMDQDTKVRSVFVPFFGRMAQTPSGPASLAYKFKLDAIPAFIHRRSEGGHTLVFHPPVPRPETGDAEADILEYTAMLTQAIEQNIRKYPDEWVWMHRRWKHRPLNDNDQCSMINDK